MSDVRDGHGLLLPFDVDDPEFSRGVEVGHIWTMLHQTDEREFTAHATNAEMLMRIGEALDLTATADDLGYGWIAVTFAPVCPSKEAQTDGRK